MPPAEPSLPVVQPSSPGGLPRNLWSALFHRWTWRMAWRDSRSQRMRLAVFSMAIVSGIAALVSIHSLKSSMEDGIQGQAKALLGSDLMVSSRQAFKPEEEKSLTAGAIRVSHEAAFSSMLSFPANGSARLVQVRGLDGGYPFYGTVRTTPADAWARFRQEPGILVEPALLEQFSAKIGDKLKLGAKELPILGVVNKAPPRSNRFSGFAPEVYTGIDQVEGMGRLGGSSLSMRALHLELPATVDSKKRKESLRQDHPESSWRLETPDDRQETVGEALDRFQQFLGIIGLASLVLGAIGVAGAIHAHIARRVPVVAVLRCLGCPGDLAFGIYLAQAVALGLLGALLGAALGIGLQMGVLAVFSGSFPITVEIAPQWAVVARTTSAGFLVCCGFALLPLLRIRNISPAATLREGATVSGRRAAGWRAWPVYLLLVGALVLLARLNDPEGIRPYVLVAGLAAAFAVLFAVAK
ncbi:MAG: FtsX-like permease family protein, partial [Verrucomicrobiaceae bacterium]